jgi:biotin carboxyl carrier protein
MVTGVVQYEVEVNGRMRRVSLERAGDRFAVSVDGRSRRVDAVRLDARSLSLVVEPGATYDVSITPDAMTGLLHVRVGEVSCTVALNANRRRRRREERDHRGSEPQRIVAPMPGKIARVLVAVGEAVRARQTVVVIEAMKMENELRATRDGTIGELNAREGAPVEAGELLAVIR